MIKYFHYTSILFCTILFSCSSLYDGSGKGHPAYRLLQGVYVNELTPTEDTLILNKGFTLITRDSTGNGIKYHAASWIYHPPCSDCEDNGTAILRLKADGELRTWVSKVHIEPSGPCSDQLILDTMHQFISFTIKEQAEGKVDSLHGIKRNAKGKPYRFVKCVP